MNQTGNFNRTMGNITLTYIQCKYDGDILVCYAFKEESDDSDDDHGDK